MHSQARLYRTVCAYGTTCDLCSSLTPSDGGDLPVGTVTAAPRGLEFALVSRPDRGRRASKTDQGGPSAS
jgi:hypothetical protein